MNLVLALEPDTSQAGLLTSLIRRKLSANLTIVPTAQAAIVAMNQRVPDVLLFGKGVPPAERDQAAAHLASLAGASSVRTLELAKLGDPAAREKVAFDVRMYLAAAEKERIHAMATLIGSAHDQSEPGGWNDFPAETPDAHVPPPAAAVDHAHLQAEVDRRVRSELGRLRREADERVEGELRRLRQEAVAQQPAEPEVSAARARQRGGVVHWRVGAFAAVVAFVVGFGALWLPGVVSTAARTSTAFAGTAQNAAKAAAHQAITAAPQVTRSALSAAGSVLPHIDIVRPASGPRPIPAALADEQTALTGPGFLTAFSRIPMDVYADGKRIGSTEDGQLLIAGGTHQVEFVSDRFRYRAMASLTIPAGHVLPYTVALPSADVRVVTAAGAEVWIDGERVGVAPLGTIHVPIGTREIAVKGSDGAEKRQVVELRMGEAIEVSMTPVAVTRQSSPVATPRLPPLTR
jgi:hypothetical protein